MVYRVEPPPTRGVLPTFGTVQSMALPPAGGDVLFFDGVETPAH